MTSRNRVVAPKRNLHGARFRSNPKGSDSTWSCPEFFREFLVHLAAALRKTPDRVGCRINNPIAPRVSYMTDCCSSCGKRREDRAVDAVSASCGDSCRPDVARGRSKHCPLLALPTFVLGRIFGWMSHLISAASGRTSEEHHLAVHA